MEATDSNPSRRPRPAVSGRWSVIVALLLLLAAAATTAWLSDDAYITFRVADNAAAGLGLVWNAAERVQAYTHPLWLLALLAGRLATGELYYTTIALSLAATLATGWLVGFRLCAGERPISPWTAALALLALLLSRAFVDYSTSGLENPLTHLLLASFLVVYFGGTTADKRLFLLALFTALMGLNRLDALLLVLPALAWVVVGQLASSPRKSRIAALVALGFLPLIAWTVFSTGYYGFPLPNTAYAKLATGVAATDLARQGVAYLFNSLRWDPITPMLIAAAVIGAGVAVVSERTRDTKRLQPGDWEIGRVAARAAAVALGIALYVLYIVRIGGDFMSGRFLSAPYLAAVVVLAVLGDGILQQRRARAVALVALLTLGLLGHVPVWRLGNPVGDAARRDGDIADERAYYTPHTGLFYPRRTPHPWAEQGQVLRAQGPAVIEHGNVGFLGYFAGPAVHIIDRNGLTDPLLARLPVRDPAGWRIGHFRRDVPPGYAETLRTGQNVIADPNLAALYERLRLVTRGAIWSRERWRAIWALGTGLAP